MKVAVVTQYFPTSGQPWAGHSAYQTLKRLALLCDLHVFYPEATYPARLRPRSSSAAIDKTWQPAGVSATYIPYPVLPIVSRPLNGKVMAGRLLQQVQAYRPHVILSYVVYPDGYAAVRIGAELGIPVVLTAIGSDLNRIPGPLVRHFTREALRLAAFTITVSSDLLRTARKLGANPDRSAAVLNGCDTAVFHPRDRQAARRALGLHPLAEVVLYAGRLDVRKGLRELVEAVAMLCRRRPAVQCFLLGDGPDKLLLEDAIGRLGMQNFIHFVPAAPTEAVAQWMAAANLFTLPSYKEGCPNVVLEALASGRPVVATNVGGIPELRDSDSGRLIPAQDVDALERGLEEVLSRSWSADEIAGCHHRSWEDVSRDLLLLLEQVRGSSKTDPGAIAS